MGYKYYIKYTGVYKYYFYFVIAALIVDTGMHWPNVIIQ